MSSILTFFVAVFLAMAAVSLAISIVRGKDNNLANNCRRASWMAFGIGLILLYLQFVLK